MLQGVHQDAMNKHDMRKCGKNTLNNTYEQQVQGAMNRHAKSKERCMLQVIDQGVINGAMDATSDG